MAALSSGLPSGMAINGEISLHFLAATLRPNHARDLHSPFVLVRSIWELFCIYLHRLGRHHPPCLTGILPFLILNKVASFRPIVLCILPNIPDYDYFEKKPPFRHILNTPTFKAYHWSFSNESSSMMYIVLWSCQSYVNLSHVHRITYKPWCLAQRKMEGSLKYFDQSINQSINLPTKILQAGRLMQIWI